MELTTLRYFSNVAATGSFSRGAQLSCISPPAMSKAIKKLEQELEVELFVRTTRRVLLTESGELLLRHAKRVLAEIDAFRHALLDAGEEVAGEVRIGAMEVFSIALLPEALTRLSETHPSVVPISFEMIPSQMVERIGAGQLDFGLTIGAAPSSEVDCDPLGISEGALVCGRRHPLYSQRTVTGDELQQFPFVIPRFFGQEHLPSLDQFPENVPRRVGASIELLQMGVQMAIGGGYLGYFPEVSVRNHLESGALHKLTGAIAPRGFELQLLTRSGGRPRRAAERLISIVREVLANELR